MSSHVAPHRWADLLQGKLADAERATLERHAAECPKCARDRKRIARASDTFPQIRTQQPPELGWDGVRARVHWSVSTARHERVRDPRRPWLKPLIGLAAAAVAVGGIVATVAVMRRHHDAPVAVAPPAAHAPVAAQHGLVSRIAGDVLIDGVRPAHPFDISLGKGTVVATGAGRVDIQFGEASAFALGPRSTLELRAFDAETIELAVEGSIELVVAPRAKNQRFLVVAGDHTIEVRGTRFSVVHDATGTSVSCQHGLVAVHDARAIGELEVGAARKAFVANAVAPGHALATHTVPLTADELGALAKSTPFMVPAWTSSLAAQSSGLEIATPGTHAVRVDGIEVGDGPLAMRVLPGRHTIEMTDTAGRFRRAGWVDAAVGNAAHFEALPITGDDVVAPPTSGIAARKLQLKAGIDRERLRACTRRLAKSGLTDTYVQIEIAIDANGAVNVLNIVDTDLPSDTASCVHDVLADVRFAAGPAATWREKLGL
jgi:hypothetical protein